MTHYEYLPQKKNYILAKQFLNIKFNIIQLIMYRLFQKMLSRIFYTCNIIHGKNGDKCRNHLPNVFGFHSSTHILNPKQEYPVWKLFDLLVTNLSAKLLQHSLFSRNSLLNMGKTSFSSKFEVMLNVEPLVQRKIRFWKRF